MNKEQLDEALKIIKEPIIVNSIEYKYFDINNYQKLLSIIEYCQYLQANIQPYVEAQDREIERLNNIINEIEKFLIDVKHFDYVDKLNELKENK